MSVEQTLISVMEPQLGARGSLVGAKVSADVPEALSPDEARRFASAVVRAADVAEEADRELLPLLERFAETRARLLEGGSA